MRRVLAFLCVLTVLPGFAGASPPVTIFAAASLKAAITEISAAWASQGHPPLVISLGSSGTLAKQIQQGAPAQIFISADEKWMDYLQQNNLVLPSTRRDLLANSLVMVAPAATAKPLALTRSFDLAALLGPSGRLAIGDPGTVPAGIYGKQALTSLDVWNQAKDHLAPTADVKAALLLVEKGEAPAGIVYATDARGDHAVTIIGTFPASSHAPITYPIALIAKQGEAAEAGQALRFLQSAAARAIYTKFGFQTK